jgi:hypothetical protein
VGDAIEVHSQTLRRWVPGFVTTASAAAVAVQYADR